MNGWSIAFVISFAQAVFVLNLLLFGRKLKSQASKILVFVLADVTIFIIEYLIIASGFYKTFPHFFGFSSGLFFLVGPSLFFYARSILNDTFRISWIDSYHMILFLIYYVFGISLFTLPTNTKIEMIDYFTSGQYPVTGFDIFLFIFQNAHLTFYIVLTVMVYRKAQKQTLVEMPRRLAWTKAVILLFCAYQIVLISIHTTYAVKGFYLIELAYVYALLYSIIIYLLAAVLYYDPKLALGEWLIKYKSSKLTEQEAKSLKQRVLELMENEKLYMEPELKLIDVADKLKVSTHQVSQLLNQEFNRSFLDFINAYRVEEFKRRLLSPDSDRFTLLGLALEVGFNSKAAFYTAFKKFTGTTPTDFKKKLKGEVA